MTVSLRPLRQGLPRIPGGEPWPPAGFVELEDRPDFLAETAPAADASPSVAQPVAPPPEDSAPADAAPESTTEVRQVPLRRGLPRTPGGEPWPPAGFGMLTASSNAFDLTPAAGVTPSPGPATTVPEPDVSASAAPAVTAPEPTAPVPAVPEAAAPAPTASAPAMGSAPDAPATEQRSVPLRRGLPRTKGGGPWPPAGVGLLTVAADEFDFSATADVPAEPPAPSPSSAAAVPSAVAGSTTTEQVPLRRGLPRTKGGEPWPPAGFGLLTVPVPHEETAAEQAAPTAEESPAAPSPVVEKQPEVDVPKASVAAPTPPAPAAAPTPPAPAAAPQPSTKPAVQKPVVQPAAARSASQAARPAPKPAPKATGTTGASTQTGKLAAFTAKAALLLRFPALALVGAIVVVGGLFMLVRGLMGTEVMTEFLVKYPGEYHLPEGAEPGFPAWVRWSHFLNMFFIILIIRSGLQNRYEKQPPAYWTPRWSWFGGGKKISISLWLHQLLDILWLLNGIVFITLLFVSGHWMRIVPTSWSVFPNALSAMLQYLSLDWPTENGWVAYNSLQQLTYFTIVFIAAPLAAITGFRMSGLWPAKATRLSNLYPLELARAVHFPTMIFFVFFVITHVAMVFATGALRNLNHMFAGTDATNWAGFWIFVVALTVIAVLWELARPMLLAPIANLLGRVSQR
ncbi:MAG: cytochrome b/b6 domain-containing protein [Microlunatus sp.]